MDSFFFVLCNNIDDVVVLLYINGFDFIWVEDIEFVVFDYCWFFYVNVWIFCSDYNIIIFKKCSVVSKILFRVDFDKGDKIVKFFKEMKCLVIEINIL